MKPKLKPPRSKRLKLRCVVPLSNFPLEFNLHRYTEEAADAFQHDEVGRRRLTLSNPR